MFPEHIYLLLLLPHIHQCACVYTRASTSTRLLKLFFGSTDPRGAFFFFSLKVLHVAKFLSFTPFWNPCTQAIPQGAGISQSLPLSSFGIEARYLRGLWNQNALGSIQDLTL